MFGIALLEVCVRFQHKVHLMLYGEEQTAWILKWKRTSIYSVNCSRNESERLYDLSLPQLNSPFNAFKDFFVMGEKKIANELIELVWGP